MSSSRAETDSSCGSSNATEPDICDFGNSSDDTEPSDLSSISSDQGDAQLEVDGDALEPIAICGFSLKFPQDAVSAESFWRMMCEKRCAMTEIPQNRMNVAGFHDKDSRLNTIPLRGGHFIKEDLGLFDADFFSISPAEAAVMDPMHRWLLETAYRALENAGIPMEQVSDTATAVYAASFASDFVAQLCRDGEQQPAYAASGFGLSMLANRLSWFFNLKGPSIGVDSACSGSAMALDIACQALRNRSCDASLVCGSNLTFAPEAFIWMSNLGFLSPDSRCKSFDHRADGYARGEGIAVLFIKRLEDAIRDGNTIRAVIRSTGSNEDGKTPGITQPSHIAQERLIRDTYEKAGLSMAHTRYFEAHGTGTAVGDPREALAIGSAFQKYRSREDPLFIGAVKSNIGHLEGASGLAGVIKALLVLEKGIIPPNTNFEKLNPRIDADHLHIAFPQSCELWPSSGLRRASIASFGFGGSNSHVVLDDAQHYLQSRGLQGKYVARSDTNQIYSTNDLPVAASDHGKADISGSGVHAPPKLLLMSAADPAGCGRLAEAYETHIDSLASRNFSKQQYIHDLAFTLANHRSKLSWRSHCILDPNAQFTDLTATMSHPIKSFREPPRIGFVFTGQGAVWSGMGQQLMCYQPFRTSIKSADQYLMSEGCKWSFEDGLLHPLDEQIIHTPEYSQIFCTVVQIALVDLLSHVGLKANAVIGHSSGEIAAAYCGGHICRESALKLAYLRGLFCGKLAKSDSSQSRGAMMAVGTSELEIMPKLDAINATADSSGLTIACINSPTSITISGDESLIDRLKVQMDKEQIFARKLRVPLAYHSAQMLAIADAYINAIGSITRNEYFSKAVAMVSTVTAKRIGTDRLTEPQYWAQNLVSPVRFSEAMLEVCKGSSANLTKKIDGSHRSAVVVNHLLEIGPHQVLKGPIKQILEVSSRGDSIDYRSSLIRNKSARETILQLVGDFWCLGASLDITALNQTDKFKRSLLVDLPEYPFDHSQSYWYESRLSKNYRLRQHPPRKLLGVRANDWSPDDARWRNFIGISDFPWCEDHKINGAVIFPGAGMLAMVLDAANELLSSDHTISSFSLFDVHFEKAMDLSAQPGQLEIQLGLRKQNQRSPSVIEFEFTIYSGTTEYWQRNCYGRVHVNTRVDGDEWNEAKKAANLASMTSSLQRNASACDTDVESERMYTFLENSGVQYGTYFRAAKEQRFNQKGDVTAKVTLFEQAAGVNSLELPQIVHPISLDAVFHTCYTALSRGGSLPMATSIPSRIGHMWISKDGLSSIQGKNVIVSGSIREQTALGFRAECGVIEDVYPNRLTLFAENIEMTNITDAPLQPSIPKGYDQSYYYFDTKAALSKLSYSEVKSLLEQEVENHVEREDSVQEKELAIIQFISLEKLLLLFQSNSFSENSWQSHYLKWAEHARQHHYHLCQPSESVIKTTEVLQNFDEVCARQKASGAKAQLLVEVAQNLEAIFSGNVDPFKLLFNNDLMKSYYEEAYQGRLVHQVSKYLDLLAHQNPGLKILEIGGGTGGVTQSIVKALRMLYQDQVGLLRCTSYDFTDISTEFLDEAQKEFSNLKPQMNFKILDMEQDYSKQGLYENTYDVVIATRAISMTSSITQALQNARKALKLGGKLIILEAFDDTAVDMDFAFGLLPGWISGRQRNLDISPLLTPNDWNRQLCQAGFSGNDIVLTEEENGKGRGRGLIFTTAISNDVRNSIQPMSTARFTIIGDFNDKVNRNFADYITSSIQSRFGVDTSLMSLQTASCAADLSQQYLIFLSDCKTPFLETLNEASLKLLQSLTSKAHHLLWVSGNAQAPGDSPGHGFVDGFTRVMRSENYNLHLVTLLLTTKESRCISSSHVTKILEEMVSREAHENYEDEYIEINNTLHTRRIVEAAQLKSSIMSKLATHHDVDSTVMRAVPFEFKFGESGQLPSARYVEIQRSQLSPDEVEIYVKAVSLDRADFTAATAQNNNTSSSSSSIGGCCAGVVIRAGEMVQLEPGDRVLAVGPHCFRSHYRASKDSVAKLSDSTSFIEACARVPNLLAAHYVLCEIAKVQKQDVVLLHHGSHPFGRALVEICQNLGVTEILTTASSHEEYDDIKHNSKLSPNAILSYPFYTQSIREVSSKRSVDVEIIDETVAPIKQSLNHLRRFGRCLKIYQAGLPPIDRQITTLSCPPNVMLSTIQIKMLIEENPDVLLNSLHYALECINDGDLQRYDPSTPIFSVSEVVEASEYLRFAPPASNVVIDFEQETKITVSTISRPKPDLDEFATYVIAGGLGGLGREIARWLADRGARYLILLSRYGPRTADAYDLMLELRASGVHVEAPAADITNLDLLRNVLGDCLDRMPPIKGCIHAGAVTKDVIFPKMTFDEWKVVADVKTKGSWNLHQLLPRDLDFFTMISSMQSVYARTSLANYAAANTYQDRLARYRIARGERAASVNLAAMADIGYLTDHTEILDQIDRLKYFVTMDRWDLRAVLQIYTDPNQPCTLSQTMCQPVMGIKPPVHAIADGAESVFTMQQPMWQHMNHIPLVSNHDINVEDELDLQKTQNILTILSKIESLTEAAGVIAATLGKRISTTFGIPEERLDDHKPVHSYGIDSLTAIDLRNWIAKTFDVDIAVFDILGGLTTIQISSSIATKVSNKRHNQ